MIKDCKLELFVMQVMFVVVVFWNSSVKVLGIQLSTILNV